MANITEDYAKNNRTTYQDNGDGSASALTAQTAAASEVHAGSFGGEESAVGVEITRPGNTTAYAVGDVVNDNTPAILTFTNLARANAKGGYIVKAKLLTDQVGCVAEFRLHLYNATLTVINDNLANTLLYANKASYLGYIDFAAMDTEESGSDMAQSINSTVRLKFTQSARTIYGVLQTKTAFTPANAQKFYIELSCELN